MFSKFFIKNPVFAIVCGLIILLIGIVCIPTLPVAQFPDISPTQISVRANYQGASAEVVEKSVTNVLEEQINGVEGLRYLTSSSSNDGTSSINATFIADRNKDLAAVDIQNRVALAEPQLPEAVQRTGVQVTKQSTSILLAIGLYTENGEYDDLFLSNYADQYLVDSIRRVEGVGNVRIFGERRYAMRLWVDPQKLASRSLTPQDVVNALREQNIQVGAGQIGTEPAPEGQEFQVDLQAISRLESAREFEEVIIKNTPGTLVKVKDIGRVELGAENYNSFLRFRGNEAVGLGIYQLPGSNALDVANAVKARMAELAEEFPPGMVYKVSLDTTLYVDASMREVLFTLLLAIALVTCVIFFFLQDWRTTMIPVITIPIALIGTFAFIKIFNFSINGLTLFGLTLATGMVVDDAIVVVEDINRLIKQEGMRPHKAAIEAMKELTNAVIATSLVLMAVFIPVAFFPGTTGALYRQFALTIAFSIAISTFLALTLTPSLSAQLLRKEQLMGGVLGWIFEKSDRGQEFLRQRYKGVLTLLSDWKGAVIGFFLVALGVTFWLYQAVPSSFLPDEDQGYFITIVQGPQGVSLQYTSEVMGQVEDILLKEKDIVGVFAVGGFSFSGSTANQGIIFTTLKPWSERQNPEQSVQSIIGRLRQKMGQIQQANVIPVNPPPIRGLGGFGGFQFQLQERGSSEDIQTLVDAMNQLFGAANERPELENVFSTYAASTPKYLINVNRDRAKALRVNIDDVFATLQIALGSSYANDFTLGPNNYRVYVQADQQFRSQPDDIEKLYVRSTDGKMIPLGNVVEMTPTTGAQTINHYNLYRSVEINGGAASGYSSGDALAAMEAVANEVLPTNFGYEWSGTSLEEIESQGQAPLIFGLGLVFVFLVLAAQYGNYLDPIIILLAVPLAILGALTAQSLRGFDNDVYCQVGLVMLIGLASKNSILIVEFANQLHETGMSVTRAAIEASQERLRPILMTAISTLLGIFPLVIATGAGAGSRRSMGTTVFGGMFIASFLSLFIVPILYIVVTQVSDAVQKVLKKQRKDYKNSDLSTVNTPNSFDHIADIYDETRPLLPVISQQITQGILHWSGATPETHFLEVGIGTGNIALPFLQQGYTYTGVDISEQMMDSLRQKLANLPHRLTLYQADARQLPFMGDFFEIAIASHLFHLIPNWQQAVQEMQRVLKPEGKLLLVEYHPESVLYGDIKQQWQTILAEYHFSYKDHGATLEEVQQYLRETGAKVEIHTITTLQKQQTIGDILNQFQGRIYSCFWQVPDSIFFPALRRLIDWCHQTYPSEDTLLDAEFPVTLTVVEWPQRYS